MNGNVLEVLYMKEGIEMEISVCSKSPLMGLDWFGVALSALDLQMFRRRWFLPGHTPGGRAMG